MPTDPETALAELSDALARDGNPGGALWSLACSQWDPYRGARDDWAAIYNMWLLLGEHCRLKSFSNGTLAPGRAAAWSRCQSAPLCVLRHLV